MRQDSFSTIRFSVDLDHQIETAFSRLIHQPWGRRTGLKNWHPAVDVFESDAEYLIEADLPGVQLQDIELHIDDHRVELRGQRRSLKLSQSARGVSIERCHGEFHRVITLADAVDSSRMEMHCDAGILHIHLPKRNPGRGS